MPTEIVLFSHKHLECVLMLLIVIYAVRAARKNLELKRQQEQFLVVSQYTQSLEKLYTDMRALRHDYTNILCSMKEYIDSGDVEQLRCYFNEQVMGLGDLLSGDCLKIERLINVKIPEVKSILSCKLLAASEKGITVHVEAAEEIEAAGMDPLSLSRILGILLDNAIEAAAESTKPRLECALIRQGTGLVIVVRNTYHSQPPKDLSKLYETGFSTKGEGRGMGLPTIRQIVDASKDVALDTRIEPDYFTQCLTIP